LSRILSNLLDNAYEALGKQGHILITADKVPKGILLTIKDNGIGIPENFQSQIGERGFTLGKPTGKGLGIWFAKQTVLQWGGTFEVSSSENKGTTITMTLPVSSPPSFYFSDPQWKGDEQLVVVDDDVSVALFWKKKVANCLTFGSLRSFREWFATKVPNNYFYILDQTFPKESDTGSRLCLELGIQKNCVLISDLFDSEAFQKECATHSLRSFPKELLSHFRLFILFLFFSGIVMAFPHEKSHTFSAKNPMQEIKTSYLPLYVTSEINSQSEKSHEDYLKAIFLQKFLVWKIRPSEDYFSPEVLPPSLISPKITFFVSATPTSSSRFLNAKVGFYVVDYEKTGSSTSVKSKNIYEKEWELKEVSKAELEEKVTYLLRQELNSKIKWNRLLSSLHTYEVPEGSAIQVTLSPLPTLAAPTRNTSPLFAGMTFGTPSLINAMIGLWRPLSLPISFSISGMQLTPEKRGVSLQMGGVLTLFSSWEISPSLNLSWLNFSQETLSDNGTDPSGNPIIQKIKTDSLKPYLGPSLVVKWKFVRAEMGMLWPEQKWVANLGFAPQW
jgi:hypothetical protein